VGQMLTGPRPGPRYSARSGAIGQSPATFQSTLLTRFTCPPILELANMALNWPVSGRQRRPRRMCPPHVGGLPHGLH